MAEFLFEITKGLIIFVGGSTSFIFFILAIEIIKMPKEEWNITREVTVINIRTNCWELIKIPVLPESFQSSKEIYIHL